MKKMILAVALLLTGIVSAQADGREKPITIDNLPKAAQEFLATYFKDLTVAYAVEESKYFGSEYEVTYTDRTEVEFRADGQWSAVDRKYSAVPAAIVPQQIADFVAKMKLPPVSLSARSTVMPIRGKSNCRTDWKSNSI